MSSVIRANREVRRCALQAMYQFDVVAAADHAIVKSTLEESPGTADDHARGFDLATLAWEFRNEADTALRPFATEWPTHRQPVIDRNLLRLAYYEIVYGEVPAKVAINEAVELAKEFGSEKSGAFVNALLDRLWTQLGRSGADSGESSAHDSPSTNPEGS
ncbi:MAG: transcription antitermination factor NusB [Phycisphaerae bacterium]|nr:transcription antitermination factor NusB [Phycisphaerae bacterium]